ncbi:protein containing DUF1568 [Rhodopirellula maiorica SM1]|uniref:Protein containing DUF1568 n=2 Tax=Novipirellula TaxID=2795426 RepID=M5RJC3_9BACT|nr:protein containing DUF1568 [Rhodopirellula maiorica SM1]
MFDLVILLNAQLQGEMAMPRPPRIQFPGAIYHVITRGDGRRTLFHDQGHYDRFTKGLADEVERSQWKVLAFCWMPNHIHALVQTPLPNLASGMQHWLSGYANWYAKRNQRTGHLFQGRYKALLVEDGGYFWTLSRYIHLNCVSGTRPLVDHPESWPHSSYPGYCRKSNRLPWVAYDDHHAYWQGQNGGKNATAAYRKYVEEGIDCIEDPFKTHLREWVFGSADFLNRMIALAGDGTENGTPRNRKLRRVEPQSILDATAKEFGCDASEYAVYRSGAPGRALAAWLCRRWTSATLPELGPLFGLSGTGSVSNLTRTAEVQLKKRAMIIRKQTIETELGLNIGNKA